MEQLVKSMRILRFLIMKNRGLDANSFWVAPMLAGSSTKYWIYGFTWEKTLSIWRCIALQIGQKHRLIYMGFWAD